MDALYARINVDGFIVEYDVWSPESASAANDELLDTCWVPIREVHS